MLKHQNLHLLADYLATLCSHLERIEHVNQMRAGLPHALPTSGLPEVYMQMRLGTLAEMRQVAHEFLVELDNVAQPDTTSTIGG